MDAQSQTPSMPTSRRGTAGSTLPRAGSLLLAAATAAGCLGYYGWSLSSGTAESVAPEALGVALDPIDDAHRLATIPRTDERPPRTRLTLDEPTAAADGLAVVSAHLETGVEAAFGPRLMPTSHTDAPTDAAPMTSAPTTGGVRLSGTIEPEAAFPPTAGP